MQPLIRWLLVWVGLVIVACKPGTIPAASTLNTTPTPITTATAVRSLPHLIAEIPLTDAALLDVQWNKTSQRLYVTDRAGKLYVLDAVTYDRLATLPAWGEITLDEHHQRLYVAPGDHTFSQAEQGMITVIDTTLNTIIDTLPGRHIAVDAGGQRLFVGEAVTVGAPTEQPGVRIYDSVTLAQTGQLVQAGIPFYNSQRNELLLLAYTVYGVDLAAQTVTTDLFPALAQQAMPWCNGCEWADEVDVFPDANLIAVYVRTHCAGGGCVFVGPPHFFDATTLAPLTELADLPALQAVGNRRLLLPPIEGRSYRTYAFHRYVTFNNLMVYERAGMLGTWRDGLPIRFLNPQTAQAYLVGGGVLDLATLTPVGTWPDSALLGYDEERGQFYATELAESGSQGVLRVIAQTGGIPPLPSASQPSTLAGHAMTAILPSPGYAEDKTLLVLADQRLLFHSTDAGTTWQQLRGGLPEGEPLTLQVAFSPTYERDQTLLAAGYRHEGQGEGVWRSTDGGATWQPVWQGLTHLRITELLLSPTFAADQTVLVKADYYQVNTGQSGESWQRSTDGGLHWSVVATSTADTALPASTAFLPVLASTAGTLPVRLTAVDHRVEATLDQGQSWQPVPLPLAADEWVQAIVPAPTTRTAGVDPVIYALSDYHLWRTTDGGQQWAQWVDPLGTPRTYSNAFRALAVSPGLADGAYQLFLGTTDGQVLTPDPTVHWLPVTP